MEISKEFTMDCAHYLPNHGGKCSNMHGHTYKVLVEIEGSAGKLEDGMIVDFGKIKELTHDRYDHQCLNDFPEFVDNPPTAENMAKVMANRILEKYETRIYNVTVTVWETPTCKAEYNVG